MKVNCIINGPWKENCYIVSEQGIGFIIDPGGNSELLKQQIKDNDLKILAIVNTHGHFDHIGAVAELVETLECPFYLHSKDKRLLKSANLYMKLFAGENPIKIPEINFYLDDFTTPLEFGSIKLDILYTPGHTDGSVCLLVNDMALFTGDTLLKGTIGRTDLPGGNIEKLKKSIKQICLLPKDTKIYPGHGDSSTLMEELKTNSRLISMI
jgi:hydroxyacylglutathione hydrolase